MSLIKLKIPQIKTLLLNLIAMSLFLILEKNFKKYLKKLSKIVYF